MVDDPATEVKSSRSKLLAFWPIIVIVALMVCVIVLPWIAQSTPLRNWIVGRAMKDPDLQVRTESASFGYFSPLSIGDLVINKTDGDLRVHVKNVECEKSWLRLWLDLPEAGTVHLKEPKVELVVSGKTETEKEPKESEKRSRPQFRSIVQNAAIEVRRAPEAEPVIDLKGLNLTVAIERDDTGQVWVVQPARVLDQTPLTPELCNDGLQLVAPMLGDALNVSGSVSLDLRKFRVPLGVDKERAQEIEIEGMVQLHDVNAGLKNPVIQSAAGLLAGLLKVELPDDIRVLNDSQVAFSIRNGRVQHQGLVFVFSDLSPELRVETSGTVGLDETLDLTLSISIPSSLLGEGPIARRFSDRPLTVQVSGTINEPKLALPGQQNILLGLGDALFSSDPEQRDENLSGTLFDALNKVITERAEQRDPNRPGFFNRIRKRRNSDTDPTNP